MIRFIVLFFALCLIATVAFAATDASAQSCGLDGRACITVPVYAYVVAADPQTAATSPTHDELATKQASPAAVCERRHPLKRLANAITHKPCGHKRTPLRTLFGRNG